MVITNAVLNKSPIPDSISRCANVIKLVASTAFCALFLCITLVAHAAHHENTGVSENASKNQQDTNMVTIKTSLGDIIVELDAEKAPASVENFLSYVKDGHYDGTIFHRVISNFMIQGGGFEPGMQQKETKPPVKNEANNGLTNDRYTVAMARTNDPHSATAQFFINVQDNDFLNFSSETSRGWGYAVFGRVVDGTDVVEKIKVVATGQKGPFGDVPVEDVMIESISIGANEEG